MLTVKFLSVLLLVFCIQGLAWADFVVNFLDVGEGEAIYIQSPSGDHILIDTGNVITGHRMVRFLEQRGVDELTALIVTHPHPDHMSGVFAILDRIPVKSLYDNGQKVGKEPRSDLLRWYAEFVRTRPEYSVLKAGRSLDYGMLKLDVLWPAEPLSENLNANSLVLRAVYKETSFLFMADAEISVEDALIKSGQNMKSHVIKIGHHGHLDASGERFLKRVAPKFAVISINRENIRGYPSSEVLGRLEKLGIETLITHRDGNVRFVSDGISVRRMKGSE